MSNCNRIERSTRAVSAFTFIFFLNSQREFIKSFNRGRMFDKESISMSDDIFVNWHWGVRCDVSVERANPHARPPAVLRAPYIQHGKWFVIDAVDTIFERVRALRRSCIRIHYEWFPWRASTT